MTAGVVSPPFGCLNAPLDERGIGSVLAYLNVRPVGVGPAGAGMSVVCYCGRLRGDDRALILCRRRLGLGILSPDAGTFASCRASITPTMQLSQDDKEGDDDESGERRHDDYPATTDRVHLVVLTADNLQLASSGAVAEGCIQPLTHWYLA
jgi:hypothetical protein